MPVDTHHLRVHESYESIEVNGTVTTDYRQTGSRGAERHLTATRQFSGRPAKKLPELTPTSLPLWSPITVASTDPGDEWVTPATCFPAAVNAATALPDDLA